MATILNIATALGAVGIGGTTAGNEPAPVPVNPAAWQ